MLQFSNGLFRIVHWNHRGRRQTIRVVGKLFGSISIEASASRTPCCPIRDLRQAEARGGLEDGKIDTEFIEPFAQ